MLKDKQAVIYGASGAAGGAVARALAREGARVFLTARRPEPVRALRDAIVAAGGAAEVVHVDALDEAQVDAQLADMVKQVGRVDISFNAIGIAQEGIQGIPLTELSAEAFARPLATYTRAHFLTARAAGRLMAKQGSGVILLHTPEPARLAAPLVGGMGPTWAALEGLARSLSAELGPRGVRTLCLRSTGMPETATIDVVFGLHARALGISRAAFTEMVASRSHRGRLTGLAELGEVAAFMASDRASAMTGTVVNLTGGIAAD